MLLFYLVLTYSSGVIAGPPPLGPMTFAECRQLIHDNQKLRIQMKSPQVRGTCVPAV